jgi:hypothetical protein
MLYFKKNFYRILNYFPVTHEVHVPAAPEQVAQEAEQAVH